MEDTLGQHIILDLHECVNTNVNQQDLELFFYNALTNSKFTVVDKFFHTFEPNGISGVFVLSESHLALHIWPEFNFISLDVYWCGKQCDEQRLINTLSDFFQPKSVEFQFLKRGYIK